MAAGARSAKTSFKPRPRTSPAPSGRGDSRERILTAALGIFSERGFDGTTTREIARRAHVNLGLLKYYFGDKEKLWKASVDRVFESLRAALGASLPSAMDDGEQLGEVIRVCVRFAGHNPAFVRLMNDEGKRDSARMRWLVARHGKPLYDTAVAVIEAARKKKLVADVPPLHLYYMLMGAMGLIFSQAPECRRIAGIDPTANERAIEAHADAVAALFVRTS